MIRKSCVGCARRERAKCTVMTNVPKRRACYVTLDQAIKAEIEILKYIDAGNYKHEPTWDQYCKTIAERRLKKLLALKG